MQNYGSRTDCVLHVASIRCLTVYRVEPLRFDPNNSNSHRTRAHEVESRTMRYGLGLVSYFNSLCATIRGSSVCHFALVPTAHHRTPRAELDHFCHRQTVDTLRPLLIHLG